ncbi:UDP-N-acetylmuramoyl-tripeptide--D-alanyl-D-alanine ligase [Enterobacteriaceae endosymbiont of Macroplea mutica]|uniref:UDP-N-acetylmuramoyl-tripeptide--D-alanyl-D- alanine ligase n=1 Tax=Enterobacteriaceae endosymbiont of Macroplea mutica TaxID=2675791 RepID=UPI001449A3A4|nr:UDP-N-acetylmuramoyl-tripeptide--D-alanyl-D-alanine ligase [Enterobacteriaceae endosymbiont of Macroplea mutica]QJC31177.1 UDP-N-acetylmuramoyl-tripeptide--D-alanyl-D-alanine ligase [Enterobacteriaceae endosymbiont of Macroplea mutica]
MYLKKIAAIIRGKLIGSNIKINNFSINSKNINNNCIFIAIHGKYFDGHNFILEAINNGAKALIVHKYVSVYIPQIIVNNTTLSLGKISAWKRSKYKHCIIGITGTTGKTSLKEMIVSILQKKYNILYTIGNMNNYIGVPLTLLKLNNNFQYAVIEIGGSSYKELVYLSKIVKPNIAIINNIDIAHLQGFKNLFTIIYSKKQIFYYTKHDGIIIFNDDDDNQKNITNNIHNKTIMNFSLYNKNATVYASNIQIQAYIIKFYLHAWQKKIYIHLNLIGGLHHISNALAAATIIIALKNNMTLQNIASGLTDFHPIKGRLYPIFIKKKQIILHDAYNANPKSVCTAINILKNIPGYKILVIGDMLELGSQSKYYHIQIGKIISSAHLNVVFSIGEYTKNIIYNNTFYSKHFTSFTDLIHQLLCILKNQKHYTILFKGSHKNNMDTLINILLKQLPK